MGQNVEESLTDNRKKVEELKLLRNVLDQNHGSTLEHVYLTYAIINASRSYLAQQTRHRMASYTSSSQHYIDHTEMSDAEVPVELMDPEKAAAKGFYLKAYDDVKNAYNTLVNEYGIDHAVARQLLPNGQRNLLRVTANVRSWINFMNQRICNRNTSEIQYIAHLIREEKTHQIYSHIQTGKLEDMMTMEQSLIEYYRRGWISLERAYQFAQNKEELKRLAGR